MTKIYDFLHVLFVFSSPILASPQQLTLAKRAAASQAPFIDLSPYFGTDTAYFSVGAATTKWIGVNSVIVETITRKTAGQTSTITTAANIAVSTATSNTDGNSIGDLIFIITPAGKALLHDIFTAAVQACGATKLKSRQAEEVATCAMRVIENAHPEIIGEIEAMLSTAVDGAGNLIEWVFYGVELSSILAAGETAVGAAVIAIAIVNWLQVGKMALDGILNIIKIPSSKLSATTKVTSIQSSSSTSSSSSEVPLSPSPLFTLFMHYQPQTTFDADIAGRLATYLGFRDATQTYKRPLATPFIPCVERTIVDCIYHYTDRPDLPPGKCPSIPVLPASCARSTIPIATVVATPIATPITTSILAPSSKPLTLGSDASGICSKIWNDGGKITMDANSIAKMFNPSDWYLSVNNYWYGVGWIKGCQTTSPSQFVGNPLADGDKNHLCGKLLSNSWKNCINNGTGGWIDAGCLRYTFKASKNKLTTNWVGVVKLE